MILGLESGLNGQLIFYRFSAEDQLIQGKN